MKIPERLGELYDMIQPDMRLTRSYFREVTSYEKEWPGIIEAFITKLEFYGCSHAREYFSHAGGREDEHKRV